MDIQRSAVPGYEANVVTLEPQEQFMLRNPDNREDAVMVDTIIAFDPPTDASTGWFDPDNASAYFVASGIEPISGAPRELDHQFTDFGVLPPHVKERFPESWRTDRGAGDVPVYAQAGEYATTQVRKARWRDERAAVKGAATDQADALRAKYGNPLREIPELTVVEYVDRMRAQNPLPTPPSTPLPTFAPVPRT